MDRGGENMASANLNYGLPGLSANKPKARSPEAWVDELPRRWAATGAIAGLIISGVIFVGPARPLEMAQAWPITIAITALVGLNWLLLGYWARWSLRSHLELSAHAALMAIRDNWLSGAAILAGTPIILRRAAVELGLYPYARPTEFDDLIAAAIAFPTMMLGAYAMSIISRRALVSRIQ